MELIVPVGVNTETRGQLLDRATRQRVELARMRADIIKLELYRDRVERVEDENRKLKTENNRLASANGRLQKKIDRMMGKPVKKGKNRGYTKSDPIGSDDRNDDTAGSSGCGVPD